jgi:hypothetical protein
VKSLDLSGCRISGEVHLNHGFVAEGGVNLIAAQIGLELSCAGGAFRNSSDAALWADRMSVDGPVFLSDGFESLNEVRLLGARVRGDLDCSSGCFINPAGDALSAHTAVIEGNVFLRHGFVSQGEVIFKGVTVTGRFECKDAMFSSLNLQMAIIKQIFEWTEIEHPEATKLDLTNATVLVLQDDAASWPKTKGKLFLKGFTYSQISSAASADDHLRWLDLQDKFIPGPYRTLSQVFHEMGDDRSARRISFVMQRRIWQSDHRPLMPQFGRVLDVIVGYGVYPERSVGSLAFLTVVGWILYRRAALAGAIAPTDEGAYFELRNNGKLPKNYPPFNPFIYALENSLPEVELGQDKLWHPDPNPPKRSSPAQPMPRGWRALMSALSRGATSPRVLRCFRWAMILVGWLLASIFIAAIAGLLKRGQ